MNNKPRILRILIQKTDIEKSKEFGSFIDLVIDDNNKILTTGVVDKGLKILIKRFKKQLLEKLEVK